MDNKSLRFIHPINDFSSNTHVNHYSVLSTGDVVEGKKDVFPNFRPSLAKKPSMYTNT